MEELFKIHSNTSLRGQNEFEVFEKFFKSDQLHLQMWLTKRMKELNTKNDSIANKLRCRGNILYSNKKFHESLEMYNRALCIAVPEKESYGLILANRSAVLYMMENYQVCLTDINLCLESNCPENSKLKVHIRKIKCYQSLGLMNQAEDAVTQALDYLEKSTKIQNKNKFKEDIFECYKLKCKIKDHTKESTIPDLEEGTNLNFLYASSSVRLSYDKERGRHVIANKQLKRGDVLFVEKPFVLAPVFINENKELLLNKCFHCLKSIMSSIPCSFCTRCLFCDEECREQNWNQFHKWECVGMQADLWYDTGIAFPALRSLIKGVPSGFCTLSTDFQADTITYGNEHDNYPYFNKLVSNIPEMKNIISFAVLATVVVLYLQRYTEFFEWALEQPLCPKNSVNDLILHVGGLMIRHIAQFQCNSSVIIHSDDCHSTSIACAMYPSVSMMNHSCKPNISLYYVCDTVIVKASESIQKNEEIFNCYGIDYRFSTWETRQEQCKNQYYFKCRCPACLKHL